MAPKILVVDDDPSISDMLTLVLETEGFDPVPVMDGNEAVPAFREHQPDLILLDLMLPGMNGVDICRAIRQESSVPIVMLTAKTDTVDVVLGLETGADDYITKPFKPKSSSPASGRACRTDSEPTEILEVGDLTIDVPEHTVKRGNEEISLTPLEFDLLLEMAASRARCTPARSCWRTCGVTATRPTPAWSTSTCSVCAPRSRRIPRTRRSCSRCGAWDTRPVWRIGESAHTFDDRRLLQPSV